MDLSTSPGEVEQLASNRRQHAESPFEDRYAFVVDSPRTAGAARLFGRMVGAGRIQVFQGVETALAHFDLGFDAYVRAEQSLQPVVEVTAPLPAKRCPSDPGGRFWRGESSNLHYGMMRP
jgi:hypothetical protein